MAIDIETEAGNPKSASNQNGSVTQHSLKEMIEAERYLKSKETASAATTAKNPFNLGCAKAFGPGGRN